MIWNMFFQSMNENKKRRKAASLMAALLLCVCIGGCAFDRTDMETGAEQGTGQNGTENTDGKLKVVTTIFPQYDFVRQIAGDAVELRMLLKPGEETHSYEPTPQDIIAIQKSDLFIYVGGENDEWIEDILDAPEMEQVNTLRLVDCVETLEEEYVEGMQEERGHDHGDYDEGEEDSDEGKNQDSETDDNEHDLHSEDEHVHTADEHVWTSPVNAGKIVERIKEKLSSLDAEHAEFYEENAAAYTEKLSELDAKFREITEAAAKKGKNTLLFGDRFPFRYFAQEYGLDYYAAFSGCSSDSEPSAATMAFLIHKVEEEKIPVVLKMELSNDNIAYAIAEATGTKVRVFYSSHNITAEEFSSGMTYLDMMEKNVETLEEAWETWL